MTQLINLALSLGFVLVFASVAMVVALIAYVVYDEIKNGGRGE
jgi:apolipoprotein N-acyltransferase